MKTGQFLSYLHSLGITVVPQGEQLKCKAPQGTLTPAIRAELTKRKAEILEFLSQVKAASDDNLLPILPTSRSETLPLSFAQERLWFLDQLMPLNPCYNMPFALRLAGKLDVLALQQSLNEIIRRHETLRTSFEIVDGQPTQLIADTLELTLAAIDLQSLPKLECDRKARSLANELAQQPFDLSVTPLMRVMLLHLAPNEHVLLLVMHHIISDGWSMGVFHRELAVLYDTFVTGKTSPLPELRIQYADFAVWQRTWLEQTALKKQLLYWQQQLADITVLQLPTDYPRPTEQSFRGRVEILELPQNLKQALVNLSQQHGVTLFMTMLATFKVLLHRYSGQTDIVVGSPIANRNRSEIEPLIGFFANTLVLRTQLEDNLCFDELLSRVQEITLGAYAHQDFPFERLVEVLEPERHLNTNPLFQVIFAVQNAPMQELQLKGLQLSPLEFEDNTTRFDMEWHVWDRLQGLQVTVSYATDLFAQDTIQRMLGHFQTLLEGVVANPQYRVSELPLLKATQQQQLLLDWNGTHTEYPQNLCIHQLFEEQVERNSNAVAVVDAHEQLTYGELNARANQLAHHLQALGVGPDAIVGICMERSIEMVVGMLGILKAGGAYLPLNPREPTEHWQLMLRDTKASVVLTQQDTVGILALDEAVVICLDAEWEVIAQHSQENLISKATPLSLMYVTYASKPGVLVEHQAVSQRLQWLQNTFVLSETDVVLSKAPLTQDTAVREIFWPLVVGGQLAMLPIGGAQGAIASEHKQEELANLQCLIAEQKVSVLNFAPSELSAFVASLGTDSLAQLNSLRLVLCSQEPLRQSVVEAFRANFSSQLHYLYSLPEAAGELTSFACQSKGKQQTVPMGYPAYKPIYVLDQHLQPVPIGVKGEIYVGGTTSLARGYLKAESDTAQRFVNNPFVKNPNARLFKTGELGRYLNDGTLEWLGSSARQTWIKGDRVELQAVEAALLALSAVEDARVLVRETEKNEPQLVAYVVLNGPFFAEQLHSQLQSVLPSYQLPCAYVPLSVLPLTKAGEVDDIALRRREVIDSELVQRWEKQLRSRPEIDQVAVVVQEQVQRQPPLHLMDLLGQVKADFGNRNNLQTPILTEPQLSNSKSSTALAISDGGPLPPTVFLPPNLAQALHQAAQSHPAKGIIYIQSDGTQLAQSYSELLCEAQKIQAGLTKLGLKPQDTVIFQLEHNQDFIPAFWGCILGGFVPVPIAVAPSYQEQNSTTSKLLNAWHMLGRPIVLTSAKLAEKICCWSQNSNLENFHLATVDELCCCEPEQNWHNSQPDDLAILLLTSGSTGVPKAVMQSHRALLSRSAATATVNNFTSLDVSLNWFGLDHVGGIVMFHIRDVYLGCQQLHAPTQLIVQNPLLWLDLIEQHQVTMTWAPNFAYGLIDDRAEELSQRCWDLSSLRFILNAGEAIVAKHARKFLHLLAPHGLRGTAMHPAWGMSETSSAVTFSHDFSLLSTKDDDKFVEVGAPIPGFMMRIVDGNHQVVTEGTTGFLQVKGLTVTSGYYGNPELNGEVFTTDGWLKTGDLGFLHQGRLTITGREKDIIIINGLNYYSHEIESVVEELDGVEVSYTAAVAVRDASDSTDKLAIFFSPGDSHKADMVKLQTDIRQQVVQNIGVNPDYIVPVKPSAIPKTTIGKIQRSQLRQRFEAGEFNDILKQLDIQSANANTLPDWFYRKKWCRKSAVAIAPFTHSAQSLVFLDPLGVGEYLCGQLEQLHQPYVKVEVGSQFVQLAANHYRLSPGNSNHYQLLLSSLANDKFHITQILHLWNYNSYSEVKSKEALDIAQDKGIYSLLFLVQALALVQNSQPQVRLLVVSSDTQAVSPKDLIAYEKGTILGLLKTIPQEMPWLSCCHLDLPPSSDVQWNGERILHELRVLSKEKEVAYRHGQRWVCRLEKADLSVQPNLELPFNQGGMYLLSGGLGGIGIEIAKYLLEHYEAKLLLVGRTPLPERSTWDAYLQQTNAIAEKISALQALEQLGGEILYQAADVCDLTQMQLVVEQAQSHWQCQLHGVIHLAGTYHESLLKEETFDTVSETLATKVSGSWVLHQLLLDKPNSIFINFSSINGFFGGTNVGAYAAANSFVDCFAQYQKYHSPLQSYCLAWSMWDEIGMSRGYQMKELTRARGYHLITAQQGLYSLLASLRHDQAQLLVGLDGSNRNLRRYMQSESYGNLNLAAYYTKKDHESSRASFQELIVCDRFGTKSQSKFVQLQEMPVTDTGEIDREQLLSFGTPSSSGANSKVEPRTEIERQLASLWKQVLRVPVLGIHDNFFKLGGHSLLATQLISRVQDVFELELPLRSLFENSTVASLGECIAQAQSQTKVVESNAIERVTRNTELPLSFAQARLWFLDQLMPLNPFYNIPFALRLVGRLDVLALERSLNQIIRRHETLRTSFETVNGQPTQLIAEFLELTLALLDLQSLPKLERSDKAQELADHLALQPFDLTVAPLLRVILLRLTPTEHVLLFVMHHIISDGWSMGVFYQELAVLYNAFVTGKTSPLPELSIQYADFAIWQRTWLEQTYLKNQLLYWQQQLADLAVLDLPTDFSRPAEQSFRGRVEILQVPENLKQELVKLSQQHGATLFMTMLAAFKVLLHRYSGQTDIAVGSPIANRNRSEIEPLIGFFVNTLVLRTQIEDRVCFDELLTQIRSVTLEAYAHQDLPFERLVEELQPERQLNSNPLVQVVFALQNAPMSELQLTGLQLSQQELEYKTTRFDMEWHVWEQPQGLQVMVAYATDLFAQDTIQRMLGHFQTLLEEVVANPQQQIWELPLLSATQHQQLLLGWNDTQKEYPHQLCIHELFEAQVEQTPDAVAVVFSDEQLTYHQLNERANKIAHYLQSVGIQPEELVGLCVERSIEMIVGMLGILKAGGAYLPLDPSYPSERLALMVSDAKVSLVLTQQRWTQKMATYTTKVVCLDTDWQEIAQSREHNSFDRVRSEHLAYVMYTSGTTGLPKGVSVLHRGVVRLVKATNYVHLNAEEVLLQLAPIAFDASTFEIWGCLLNGGRLVVMPPHKPSLPELGRVVEEHQVTTLWLTAGLFHLMVEEQLQHLRGVRQLLAGGDVLSVPHVQKVVAQLPQLTLINGYGPTENTTFTCCCPITQLTQVEGTVPIGRPISNTQVYILDEHLKPVPIGVPGELYTSGDGLCRGYLNRPETTAEKFIPNPYSDQPGVRLYKTGDKARYLADGFIEFLGRIDNQIKLRGYRIELGEIEFLLNQHPLVQQTVAIVREDSPGVERIVAYCTPDLSGTINTNPESTQLPTEHLSQWQTLYDQTYAQPNQQSDATFNIIGWNSSYTNQPIPPEQMRQWLNGRVNHIRAFQPQRVLEIGCGTGLLLFQIAPYTQHYYGTDFSPVAISSIARQLRHPEWHLPQVQLQQKLADDFEGIETGSFDTVILNSVVQYFPSIDYLLKVLTGALKAVAPGGIVFIGDVRSLPLLEAFHASVQLYQAQEELSIEQLRQRVQAQISQETELVIAPEFFLALKQHLPQIANVQIHLQRGDSHNELSCFRYDVTLEVGSGQSTKELQCSWHEWESIGLSLESTAQLLESQSAQLGIVNIPNARVLSAIKTVELLSSHECPKSISQLRTAINTLTAESGVEPEQFWNMAQQYGYTLAISWSETDLGCYDVVFSRQSTQIPHKPVGGVTPLERKKVQPRAWQTYANNPLQLHQSRQLQSQLHGYLEQRLPEYMVPSAIVILDAMPLTPNGKVDRNSLPSPEASRGYLSEAYVAPRTPIEEILVSLWAEILGQQQIGIHDNFFDLGGHSLLATQLISRVRDVLQLELPLRCLFEAPTPAQLAESIAQTQGGMVAVESSTIERVEREEELPLSFAQARLWFLDQLRPLNPFYNMPSALRVTGLLDVLALQRSLNEIIRRHETLRTSFLTVNGQPTQSILPSVESILATIDLQSLPEFEREQKARFLATELAQQPFDLRVAPLMRVMLLRLAPHEHVLLLVMHHVISDGWSWGVLHRELAVLYDAFVTGKTSPLPELSIQYADFAVWQRTWLEHTVLKTQLLYWLQQLANLAVLDLPTDYSRPVVQSFRGGVEILSLPQNLKQALVKLSQQHGVTLFMTMLAAFKVLLHRYSGQTDIVVGSPIANRNRSEIEPLIGFFVNTLVLRTQIQSNLCFSELLTQVRSVTLGAYAHQDLPFERLVEELQPERQLNSNPLFQVMFALQNAPMSELQLTGLQLSRLELEYNMTRLDMEWHVWEQPQGLQVMVAYATDLFAQDTIQRMLGHFQTLLEAVVANPQQQIWELPLLSATQQQQLLLGWNDTQKEYPHHLCIHELFEAQVEQTPDAVAVVFEEQQLTYDELNERANKIAHYLQSVGIQPEELVGLCVERSIEMIVGLLGILKAGGAYLPLDPSYPSERLALMVSDAKVSLVLTQQRWTQKVASYTTKVVCLDTDWQEIAQSREHDSFNRVRSEHLAYVMYTSGTTGLPKGVSVLHRGVIRLVKATNYVHLNAEEVLLQLAPIAFDASTFEIWGCLLNGGRLVVMPPHKPSLPELGRVVEQHQVTTLWLTVGLFHLMVEEQLQHLRGVRQLLAGGDVLSVPHVQKVVAQLPQLTLINGYGPTENTTFTCCCPITQLTQVQGTVPIGRPISNTQVYILDEHLKPVPIGVAGELYTSGDGLSRGYLNRPELTAQKFIPNPFSSQPGVRLYKTGDKARYLADGFIEFLGRIDNQVKIRGFRIELGEIEAALTQHPQVRETVAIAGDDILSEKRIIAYIVPAQESIPTISELRAYLKQKLPEYMVPSAIVMLDALPLTPSGKVDRKALKVPEASRGYLSEAYVAPRTPMEEILVSLWAEILGQQQIGIHDNFFDLGGHSLLATQLISRVRDVLQLELPLRYLFEAPTPALLAESIAQTQGQNTAVESNAIERVAREEELPLSFAQARLWFLDQLRPLNPFYNMPFALRVTGLLDVLALQRSLNEIIRRHETLRTSFLTVNGQPTQSILPSVESILATIDLQSLPEFEREQKARFLATELAQQPFDLRVAPLMRVMLLRLAPHEHVLLLVMHHVISDGWSWGVLHRELAVLYDAFVTGKTSPLPELSIQYADFAVWQRTWLEHTVLKTQLLYWLQQLANLAVLDLPTDYSRPVVQSFRGGVEILSLPQNLKQALVKLSQQHGVTLFMTMLAAFKVLLHRYSGQTDIVVGSPIANRNRSEIEPLIGFFVNTLVLRTQIQSNLCFSELLTQVRSVTLEAYAHQDLPFERLVEALQPERHLNSNPLFQVVFALQNAPMSELQLTGLQLSRLELEYNTTRLDMEWHVWEQPQGLQVMVAYATDLFAQNTIQRMLGHFQTLLEAVVANPRQQIWELPLLSATQQQQLLFDWNHTAMEYQKHLCINELFEAQVEVTPDAVALVFEDQRLTYSELNVRANRLAHYLQSVGVKPEVLVGLYVERSLEMVLGILAILKAGGAYVPLDPSYPEQRLAFILSDTGVSVLLTQLHLVESLSQHSAHIVCLDTQAQAIAQHSQDNPNSGVTTQNLAYVIYTSGSTGLPKGVLVSHSGLCNLATAQKKIFDVRDSSHVLQFASLSFDASIWEVVMALNTGATLYLGTKNSLLPGKELIEMLGQHQMTHVTLPPSALAVLPKSELKALQTMIVAGEACSQALVRQWAMERKFFNAYGPTEATVCATVLECSISGKLSIGHPIANTQVYLLDEHLKPVPIGIPGELYISGVGLSRGYLNRPETTAEKFIPNPWSSQPGVRLYKTGDRARYLADGNIEFLGRIDNQVKIRGFRIELGEIEAALTQHPQVRETVAIAGDDMFCEKRIIAYIVPEQESIPTISELRAFLKQKLPEYMVPSAIVMLEVLPLTPNGKVDRRALPAPDFDSSLSAAYVAPETELEQTIARVWQQVLHREKVGIHDNFFDNGGHSLLLAQVHSQLQQLLDKKVLMVELFQYPTINSLANYLTQSQPDNTTVEQSYQQVNKQKEAMHRHKQRRQRQLKDEV
ncbi:amino acid adenylation domain-containing protein [Scytonema sp. UIC 10036]|uniref:non-ribosomal peptide synthase/polyketide synthase n=1 Tax=Scytonema sp. UIC 10036 TaxID=2304196 RepID=UPI0012DA8602|nr:non-ribosomal peptide synthase/polyketide synthase [Scytonema sp. UIC 10036]MUG92983.1 amino acid adenylation domain-containing protein [Scytonema sp. UIC 10036]